jgi:type II secretory pathway component PulF
MSIISPHVATKQLAALCRRTATSLTAGIDVRRTFAREAQTTSGALGRNLGTVSETVARGGSLAEGFRATGEYFPPLFRQLVEVGEQTGHTAEIFSQLAEHYEHQLALRRSFVSSIAWPLIQLTVALATIGLLIWIMGWLETRGSSADLLGWGLKGTRGLAIYLAIVGAVAAAIGLMIQGVRRGAAAWKPVQSFLLRLPGLGGAMQTLALARFSWTLHLTLDTGMDVRRALRIALENSNNVRFEAANEPMQRAIGEGRPIHEVMSAARVFPPAYVDAVTVGEESGRLVETLAILSRQQQEEARTAMSILVRLAGFAVWAMVAVFIIVMIFRLFGFYVGTIQSLAK